MSSDGTTDPSADDFGANDWLVEEMYEAWVKDPTSVDASWVPTLETYAAKLAGGVAPSAPASASATEAPVFDPNVTGPITAMQPASRTTSAMPTETPIPAQAPGTSRPSDATDENTVTALKGMSKALAANMDASLTVPTATSVRTIPAKLMIDNRIVVNNHLRRTRGGKVSFTHIIGWAMIRALKTFPSQNVFYDEPDGVPSMVIPAHINLGLAIDIPKPDGSRALVVPGIKKAEQMNFADFLEAYEDVVARARANKLTAEDFAGNTMSLTNPGGIGTVHSVPRLMRGQGCIIGAGALDYPAEFQGSSETVLFDLGISKTITLTSTYDHRVIQGAGSGEFLKIVHGLLIGQDGFYEEIFAALRIPYIPIRWSQDIKVDVSDEINKTARVQELVDAYRVRGHRMADVDPLQYQQRTHPDLEIENHGLTFWDLDREFVVGGLAGRRTMLLREVLGLMRDSYCRTVGVEYTHLSDPEQRAWFQEMLEQPYQKPTHDEQLRILDRLNQAEAFETFLQTKFVGQKRFSLEGGESIIALLDEIIQEAADFELDEVDIGMAHRGRLNVLANIAGKTYGQIFREFEGTTDTSTVQGSGDVKYHLGTKGEFTTATGQKIPVYLAANPSHLEAVNGVLEGIVRAKQDHKPIASFTVLPILVHGDAAMAGQGVVIETMQMAQLRGYRTGGTIHVVANNQVGFTTLPKDSRTSLYSTDVARSIQAPIFHVNGDDPEAVVRVAKLAVLYRQKFKHDVVIDVVCYRRRGHNEGDDPSMTQPLMYNLIEAKRSVRTLYAESLVGRGDITQEEYDGVQAKFLGLLEQSFSDNHDDEDESAGISIGTPTASQVQRHPQSTAVDSSVIHRIGDAHGAPPEGFTVHPKLEQLLAKRIDMSRSGDIDWGFGELLALGSLLLEGKKVRFAGQDSRRGTFVQRHAVFHDRVNGQEWLPLMNLSDNQGRFYIYDSLLSEYAAMAYEYGYTVGNPDALVLWEAQFGDFANGAQTVIDEFISSSEQKWGQNSGLVLLLPHGYEGQGPDHSSARIERYLQMAAEGNMTIARPSTPASYFHLLRRQAYAQPQRPLIVFTPKAMLRLRGATSSVDDFTTGTFEPVLDDQSIEGQTRRVLLHSGKIHYDLLAEREKRALAGVALVRMEQYYPFPEEQLRAIVDRHQGAELVWVQDEPENQGAWPFIALEMRRLGLDRVRVVSRPASASPATGSSARSAEEHIAVMDGAFDGL
ncbi:MAG: multifunctional oxoglutarate decarboxylase/oxoglutarate dehydrogenase thiamine pyrophosphate-binding subunit/dihydrolipoyllysine-residue succinyltransferase subunit [Microbacteriaceae bacterium]|nr:multifunctional oxoglutarate decarboxylase/oxoglutarate dehydrogenase thiamine pyrophosphate-binding subunit/dihydrolipoyllysine-residue succinyltransferase subunit [Microbacteriaceae bacterium]